MKPLVPAAREARVMAASDALGAAALALAGLVVEDPLEVVAVTAFSAVWFFGWMYPFLIRRHSRAALVEVRPAPTDARESERVTLRRIARDRLLLIFVLVLGALASGFGFVAGALAGFAAAFALVARRYRRWESDHGTVLLREPNNRFRGEKSRWGGRGVLDRRDFYADPAAEVST